MTIHLIGSEGLLERQYKEFKKCISALTGHKHKEKVIDLIY